MTNTVRYVHNEHCGFQSCFVSWDSELCCFSLYPSNQGLVTAAVQGSVQSSILDSDDPTFGIYNTHYLASNPGSTQLRYEEMNTAFKTITAL